MLVEPGISPELQAALTALLSRVCFDRTATSGISIETKAGVNSQAQHLLTLTLDNRYANELGRVLDILSGRTQ